MIFEYGFKDFLQGIRYRIEALFYSQKIKEELKNSQKLTDYYRPLSLGPIGTEKRDEYEALTNGKLPSKPLKYFSVHYRVNDNTVSFFPDNEQSNDVQKKIKKGFSENPLDNFF